MSWTDKDPDATVRLAAFRKLQRLRSERGVLTQADLRAGFLVSVDSRAIQGPPAWSSKQNSSGLADPNGVSLPGMERPAFSSLTDQVAETLLDESK